MNIYKTFMITLGILAFIFLLIVGDASWIIPVIIAYLMVGVYMAFVCALAEANVKNGNYKKPSSNKNYHTTKSTYSSNYFSSSKNDEPKSVKNAEDTFYTNRGYKSPLKDSADSWDDFYELKKSARKELDKGNITRSEYDKIVRDAENSL